MTVTQIPAQARRTVSSNVTAGAAHQLNPTLVTSQGPIGHSTFHATAKPVAHIRLGVSYAMIWVVLHAPVGR
jgi:hypothetical protein